MLWHKATRGHCVPAVVLTNTYLALLKSACWAGCKFDWKLNGVRCVWETVLEYCFIRACPGNWVTGCWLNLNVWGRIEEANQKVVKTDRADCNHSQPGMSQKKQNKQWPVVPACLQDSRWWLCHELKLGLIIVILSEKDQIWVLVDSVHPKHWQTHHKAWIYICFHRKT